MAYNLRLIEHGNKTVTIKYYLYPIYSRDEEEDYQVLGPDADMHWDEEALSAHGLSINPFDGKPTEAVEEFEFLTEEEKEKRAERSLHSSVSRSKNAVYELARSREWEWFLTFTFSEKYVDRYNYTACFKKIKGWIRNHKNRYFPEMAYLVVPEMHRDGAWHFHGLFAGMPEGAFSPAVNSDPDSPWFGTYLRTSYPDGDYIYNLPSYRWGFTTATRIKDSRKAAGYLLKYMTKELCSVTGGLSRYHASRGLARPQKTLGLYSREELDELLKFCDSGYDIVYQKNVDVVVDGYDNRITYIELEPKINQTEKQGG